MASKSGKFFLRAIAILLVAALLAGMLVFEKTAVRLDPSSMGSEAGRYAASRFLEGSGYARAGRLERMGIYTRSILSGHDSAAECFEASQIALASGDLEGALRYTNQALTFGEGSEIDRGRYLQQAAYINIMLERREDAEKYLTRGLELTGDADGLLVLAWLKADADEEDAAKDRLSVYLETTPSVDTAAGSVALLTGDPKLIRDTHARLYKQSGRAEHLVAKAYGEYALGETDAAAEDLDICISSGAADASAHAMAAIIAYRKGAYDKALELFEAARGMEGADVKLCDGGIVLSAVETGDYARAAQAADAYAAEESLENSGSYILNLPADGNVYNKKAAAAYAGSGEYEKAEAAFGTYLAACPDDAAARRVYAGVELYLEKYDAALTALDGLEDADAALMRGLCLMGQGKLAEAEEAFQCVIDADAAADLKDRANEYLLKIKSQQSEETK